MVFGLALGCLSLAGLAHVPRARHSSMHLVPMKAGRHTLMRPCLLSMGVILIPKL